MTRSRILAVALFLALLFVGGAAWAWYRQEDPVERAVREDLEREGREVDWVSCDEDHTWKLGEKLVTFYRCDVHGGEGKTCSPFVDGRNLTTDEARKIPFAAGFCKNSG